MSYEALAANNRHTHANLDFCIERRMEMEKAIEHVLRYGKLGKQSRRRLKEALRG